MKAVQIGKLVGIIEKDHKEPPFSPEVHLGRRLLLEGGTCNMTFDGVCASAKGISMYTWRMDHDGHGTYALPMCSYPRM
jgi:hypothetical protein